jgi:molecular chaperone DnaK (HSP70)
MGAAVYGQKLAIGRRIRTEIAKELGTSPDEVSVNEVAPDIKERARETVAGEMGMRLPALRKLDDMTVTNVASHSFGIVAVKQSGSEQKDFISNLVLAQQPLPATRTREFGTLIANQQEVQLRIMENTARSDELEDLDEGEEIGEAVLALSQNLPAGSPIEVTFVLNQEGRLHITGKDMAAGGKTVTATIETHRALSAEELTAATERARGITVTG